VVVGRLAFQVIILLSAFFGDVFAIEAGDVRVVLAVSTDDRRVLTPFNRA
jgi:hypothetical protein